LLFCWFVSFSSINFPFVGWIFFAKKWKIILILSLTRMNKKNYIYFYTICKTFQNGNERMEKNLFFTRTMLD
jgi:hypothetical protein